MCKRLLLFILLCSMAIGLQATIGITASTDPTGETACNGTITVTADGSAGPFTLRISGPNGFSDQVDGIRGEYTFRNLCGGSYAVGVESALMCERTFNKELKLIESCNDTGDPFPYIQRVQLLIGKTGTPKLIYDAQWQDNGAGCLVFYPNSIALTQQDITDLGTASAFLQIKCYPSQNMQNLSVSLAGTSLQNLKLFPLSAFYFHEARQGVNAIVKNGQINQVFEFHGLGEKGKSLLDLRAMSSNVTACVSIPQFNPLTCEWTPGVVQGKDDVHVLTSNPCANFYVSANTIPDPNNDGRGAVSLNIIGGTAPFTYRWNNGATTASLNNVHWGEYCVTVTDSKGCVKSLCAVVCTEVSFSAHLEDAICGNEGYIGLRNISHGFSPLNFRWSNGGQGTSIANLVAGIYTLTITDGKGCKTVKNFEIKNKAGADIYEIEHYDACLGQSNGKIVLDIFSPGNNYSVLWDNGATTATVENLSPGDHCVTVTNQTTLCQTVQCFTINTMAAEPLSIAGAKIYDACPGIPNGTVLVSILKGPAPYTYEWSDGKKGTTIEQYVGRGDLAPGEHCVTVTDHCGQSREVCFAISSAQAVSLIGTTTNACFGQSNGSIRIFISPSNAAINAYQWSNGSTTKDLLFVPPGVYCLTVTYANSRCSTTKCFSVGTNPAINISGVVKHTCTDYNKGEIAVTVSGGTSPYRDQLFTPGGFGNHLINLSSGVYNFQVTDANGCIAQKNFTVGADPLDYSHPYSDCRVRYTCHGEFIKEVLSARTLVNFASVGRPPVCTCTYRCTLTGYTYSETCQCPALQDTLLDQNAIIQVMDGGVPYTSNKVIIGKVVPNPFSQGFSLELYSGQEQDIKIGLTDVLGRSVISFVQKVYAGENFLELQLSEQIPSGGYMLTATGVDGQVATHRLVKMN